MGDLIFFAVYTVAIGVVIVHFTGWFERHNMEWAVLTSPVVVFSVIILSYLQII